MIPYRLPYMLEMRQNGDFGATVVVQTNGSPFNLTGYGLEMAALKPGDDYDSPSLDLGTAGSSTAEGLYIADAVNGVFTITVFQATLAAISDTTGEFMMDFDIRASKAGHSLTIIEGQCHVRRGITH